MILTIHFILLILILSPTAAAVCATECAGGTRTRLTITRIKVPLLPRHGQAIGQTSLVLRSEPGGEIILSKEYDGNWICIGFNRKMKTHIVGVILERGAWLPLGSIRYLPEDGTKFEPSAFDRLGYHAMTVVSSPGGRYIVFIGGRSTTGTLYVLDTERDMVEELGPAPAPPPNAQAGDVCFREPFQWGTCWGDGYVEMDKGIIRFLSDDVLEVRYGHDTPEGRAKNRRVKRFKLD